MLLLSVSSLTCQHSTTAEWMGTKTYCMFKHITNYIETVLYLAQLLSSSVTHQQSSRTL